MKTLMREPYAEVLYIPEYSEVRIIWLDISMSFDDYKNAFTVALKCIEDNRLENYLSDIREQKVLPPSYRKWFQTSIIPKAKAYGLKRASVIFEGNVLKKYYLNHILNTTKKFGIELKFFSEIEQGEKWFKSQMQ